jgi:hypothetical protein
MSGVHRLQRALPKRDPVIYAYGASAPASQAGRINLLIVFEDRTVENDADLLAQV